MFNQFLCLHQPQIVIEGSQFEETNVYIHTQSSLTIETGSPDLFMNAVLKTSDMTHNSATRPSTAPSYSNSPLSQSILSPDYNPVASTISGRITPISLRAAFSEGALDVNVNENRPSTGSTKVVSSLRKHLSRSVQLNRNLSLSAFQKFEDDVVQTERLYKQAEKLQRANKRRQQKCLQPLKEKSKTFAQMLLQSETTVEGMLHAGKKHKESCRKWIEKVRFALGNIDDMSHAQQKTHSSEHTKSILSMVAKVKSDRKEKEKKLLARKFFGPYDAREIIQFYKVFQSLPKKQLTREQKLVLDNRHLSKANIKVEDEEVDLKMDEEVEVEVEIKSEGIEKITDEDFPFSAFLDDSVDDIVLDTTKSRISRSRAVSEIIEDEEDCTQTPEINFQELRKEGKAAIATGAVLSANESEGDKYEEDAEEKIISNEDSLSNTTYPKFATDEEVLVSELQKNRFIRIRPHFKKNLEDYAARFESNFTNELKFSRFLFVNLIFFCLICYRAVAANKSIKYLYISLSEAVFYMCPFMELGDRLECNKMLNLQPRAIHEKVKREAILSEEEIKRLKMLFDFMDTDGSGNVDKHEILKALKV